MSNMDWVDNKEEKSKEDFKEGYFNIQEGDNRIQLLTHCSPLAQTYNSSTKKYEVAEEGEVGISIKGVCWVLQDGKIKQAKLPYTVVKQIRSLQTDPDWGFEEFPMNRLINIKAKNAGTKEVEYTVVPAPQEVVTSDVILAELSAKPSPEDMVEKIKGKSSKIDDFDTSSVPF